jgi:hypothetical protein
VQISKELKDRKVGDEAAKGQELIWNTHQVRFHFIPIAQETNVVVLRNSSRRLPSCTTTLISLVI